MGRRHSNLKRQAPQGKVTVAFYRNAQFFVLWGGDGRKRSSSSNFVNISAILIPDSDDAPFFAPPSGYALGQAFQRFFRNCDGATAIEYALIGSILALAIVTGLTSIGTKLSSYFSEVSSSLK